MADYRTKWVFSDLILNAARYMIVSISSNVFSIIDEATGGKVSAFFTGLTLNEDVVTTNSPIPTVDVLNFKSNCEYTGSTTKSTQVCKLMTLNNGTLNTGFGLNGFYNLVETPASNTNALNAGINSCNFVHAFYGTGAVNATFNGLVGAFNYASTVSNNSVGRSITANALNATGSISSSGSIDYLRGAMITTNLSSSGNVSTELIGIFSILNLTSTGTSPDIKGIASTISITGSPASITTMYGGRFYIDFKSQTNTAVTNMMGIQAAVVVDATSVSPISVSSTMVAGTFSCYLNKAGSTALNIHGITINAGTSVASQVSTIANIRGIDTNVMVGDSVVSASVYGHKITGTKNAPGVITTAWYGLYLDSNNITTNMGAGTTAMWDLYITNTAANNYIGGALRIGTTTNPGTRNEKLVVVGTASFGNNTSGADATLFEADGTMKMIGNATVWGDVDFPMIIRSTGANIPVQTALLGNLLMPLWQVNDYNQADGQELPHDWKEASPLQWHLHIYTNTLDATARYVQFEVEYTWANRGSALITPVVLTSGDLLIPANTPAKTHLIFNIGAAWTPTDGAIAAHVKARLRRIASTGTAPSTNPFCDMLQLHYEKDTIGSRQITTK